MIQVFSKSFGKVGFFGVRVCAELEYSSFSIEISDLADVDGLEGGFRFRRVGRDKVAGEAARSISHACPGTGNEICALRHIVGVA